MRPFRSLSEGPGGVLFALSFALWSASFLPAGTRATIINVPTEQATIQAAIDVAVTGDTVLVASGHYLENIDYRGKQIVVSSHFMLDRDPAHVYATIIDGSSPSSVDSASTVRVFCRGAEAPVLQGFTITGGRGTRMLDPDEGHYYRHGGGVVTHGGSPVIRFNYIHHNRPDGAVNYGGGGICVHYGNATIDNNLIVYNPGTYGCGIFGRQAYVTASNNVVAFNSGGSSWGGAGIYFYGGRLDGYNNTVAFNYSEQAGAGLRVAQAEMHLWNSIIWGNMMVTTPSQTVIDGSGVIALQYSDIQGGYAGTGNVDADPALTGSWCLTGEGSPCIDAGDPDPAQNDLSWPSAPTAARWPSRGGLRNDMGACGGPGAYPFELVLIRADETLGWAPLNVSFAAESHFDADEWSWEFGDGDGAAGQATVHTYNDPGVYDVTVTVSHDEGASYEHTAEGLINALADTMWVGDAELTPNMSVVPVEILVYAHNYVPAGEIWIPVAVSGDLNLVYDGFTTEGCRTAGFATQIEHWYDHPTRTGLFQLAGDPGLSPGSGPILKLLFNAVSALDGQTATISLTSDLISRAPEFSVNGISYEPITVSGLIQYDCCADRIGDANGSGEDMPTIGDISVMIDAKFITGECIGEGAGANIRCLGEADANLSGGDSPTCEDITIGDISMLIDCLFVTGEPPFVRNECSR